LQLCFQVCDPCTVPTDVRLPCGHMEIGLACFTDITAFNCGRKCDKTLTCGHACKFFCNECSNGCQKCQIPVLKTLSCGHDIKTVCSSNPAEVRCQSKCQRVLSRCGHPCPSLCFEDCDSASCQVLVKVRQIILTCMGEGLHHLNWHS
jgi:hypothetical protein